MTHHHVESAANAHAEAFSETWLRRACSCSLYATAWVVLVLFSPLLLPLALLRDAALRTRLATLRTYAFAVLFLSLELFGIFLAALVWGAQMLLPKMTSERYAAMNFALQSWWGDSLARAALRIFGMRVQHDEGYTWGVRPAVLFIRHSSFADTIIAVHLISKPHGIKLRYVLKRELLWDPCLDIVGNRLPNVFIRRNLEPGDPKGGANSELERVAALAEDLGNDEGVLIYPEGTRFSPEKRAALLARFREKGDAEAPAFAESLTHTLPPRLGGALALLERNPGADAVFLAHTGLEGASTFASMLRGDLAGCTLKVKQWGVRAEDIPKEPRARVRWLQDQWRQVNSFVREGGR